MSPSDPTLEQRALALLDEALERPSPERPAWVDARTRDDPALRGRLLALIAAADRGDGALRTGGAPGDVVDPEPPERIGAYRIVDKLGQGGMGAVYRAERYTGDFKHTVAIKIIRPGALSDALVERFARERQTLADLAHPNIARLFDGGATLDGQPFIVMEYVAGRPITDWATERRLDARARLGLFLSACEAVRYAHQNLIIHRDLTPSNVLVTVEGVVKLIDFGIARPPEAPAAEQPSQASLAGLSLTPGFAAPERVAGAGASTLVDIYSLGRLLEALLQDQPLDAELAAIAARATADAPEGRYPSVDALIDDVRKHLSGHPVAARGGGRRYVLGKFVGRHRMTVALSTTGIVLLVGALALTLAAYGAAASAREAEARRFTELRSLARYMLFDLNDQLKRVVGNTGARAGLAAQAQRYLSALADSRTADPDLKLEAARGLIALADVQGAPAQPNLGDSGAARRNFETALRLIEETDAPGAATAADRAQALTALAMIDAHIDTDMPRATKQLTAAEAALADATLPTDARWRAARSRLRRAQIDLAVLAQEPDRIPPLTAQLEREANEGPAELSGAWTAELDRAYADQNRAIHGWFVDDFTAGIAAAERAERRLLALDKARPNDPVVLYTLAWNSYSGFGAASGLPERAERMDAFLSLGEATLERLLRIEENDRSLRSFTGQLRQARAQALGDAGRLQEALAAQRDTVRLFEAALGRDQRPATLNRVAAAHATLGKIAIQADDRETACTSFRNARDRMGELERRNELLGSIRAYRAAVDANLALCSRGAPVSAMSVFE